MREICVVQYICPSGYTLYIIVTMLTKNSLFLGFGCDLLSVSFDSSDVFLPRLRESSTVH